MSLMIVSDSIYDDEQQEEDEDQKEDETVTEPPTPFITPYPPGIMLKRNKKAIVHGDVHLKVYTNDHRKLVVVVEKATGLGVAKNSKNFYPYAMGYVLPDHQKLTKKKTKVELRTADPVWDSKWEYQVPESDDFVGKVLWVSVWSWSRFSKADFLGEVMLPLWTMDLHDKTTKSYQLQPEQSVIQSAGDLKLSLCYQPPDTAAAGDEGKKKKKQVYGRLHVRIMEAKDLFYDKSYVKGFLRPGKQKVHHHQITKTVDQPKCPVYDEEMVFEKVTMETLSTAHVLEVAVWDAQFIAYPMGVIRLGPQPTADSKPWMDSEDAEVSHWEAMLSQPNQWVEQWHVLRPDADFRDITKSSEDAIEASRSVEDDGETSDEDDQTTLGNTSTTKPILVVPGGDDDGVEEISLEFPRETEKKASFELDDYEFRSLTKKNTKLNSISASSIEGTTGKLMTINSNMSDARSVYSGSVMYTHEEVTGEIQMGVSYSDTDNTLKVSINKVRGLTPPNKINEVHTNPYVKTYLLPDRSKTTKKKTSVKKGVDPIFNETIKYPIKRHELSKHTLKVGVWHNDFWRHNLFLGEVTLPLDKVDWSNPSDKWYGLEELTPDTSQSTDRGQLKVSLQFNITNDTKQKGDLVVTIISGHNLLQTELTCNPVVKCHLLPDYRKKFKTKVLKDSSTDPEWNEQFLFDHLKLEDLCKNRVLELTVWNSTKNSKHYDFIGGLRLGPSPHHKKQLSYMDSSENELLHWMSVINTPGECVEQLHTLRHNMNAQPVTLVSDETDGDVTDGVMDATNQSSARSDSFTFNNADNNNMIGMFTTNQLPMITVQDEDNVSCFSQQICAPPPYTGDIRVMLQFDGKKGRNPKKGTKGCLHVCVQQARQLNLLHGEATFVQCTLLPHSKTGTFKSDVVQDGDSPCYTAKFQFDKVTDVELSYDRVLEITIWEPHRNTNEFVGGVRLGPKPQPGSKHEWMDSVGSEVSQWEMMVARPEEWVDEWHLLHSFLKPAVVPH